ncbi:hypothetical protein ACN20G_26460 (plasmid) [Streptomyces sp. BI20]
MWSVFPPDGSHAGFGVRHDDFIAPDPSDPTARDLVGGQAAVFSRQHLG